VLVLLHRKGLEAALVKGPGADGVAMGVPALGMRQGDPVQVAGQLAILLGPENQMPVRRHQAEGEQADGDVVMGLAQDLEERGVVAVLLKEGSAACGPVEGGEDKATGSEA
jgi:hypothetical protein